MSQRPSNEGISQPTSPASTTSWRAFTSRISTYLGRRSGPIKNGDKKLGFVGSSVRGATSRTSTSARPSSSTSFTLLAESDVYFSGLLGSGASERMLALASCSNEATKAHLRSSSLPDPRSLERISKARSSVFYEDSCPNLTDEVRLLSLTPIYIGAYSRVYRGECNNHNVAVKIVSPLRTDTLHATRRRMRREVETARHFEHPNLLAIYGVVEAECCPYGGIITPWCQNGDAARYIRLGHVETVERYDLLCGVASGLQYLHDHSVVHGDLKPGNILVDELGIPLIGDFGLTSIIEAENHWQCDDLNTTTAHEGTPRYLAYELVMPDPPAPRTRASDIHALGCIGYEFLYLLQPYSERSSNVVGQIFRDIAGGRPPAIRPSSDLTPSGTNLWDLFERSWDKNPVARPDISDFCASLESLAGCELEPLPGTWHPSFSTTP